MEWYTVVFLAIFKNGHHCMLPIRYIFMSPIPKHRRIWPRARAVHGRLRFHFPKNHRELKNTYFVENFRRPSTKLIRTTPFQSKNFRFGVLKQFGPTCRMPNFLFKSLHPAVNVTMDKHNIFTQTNWNIQVYSSRTCWKHRGESWSRSWCSPPASGSGASSPAAGCSRQVNKNVTAS